MGGRGRLKWPGENWSLLLVAIHQLQAIVSRPSSAVRWCGRRSVSKLAKHRVLQSKDIIKSKEMDTMWGLIFIFERAEKAKASEVPQLASHQKLCTPPGQPERSMGPSPSNPGRRLLLESRANRLWLAGSSGGPGT